MLLALLALPVVGACTSGSAKGADAPVGMQSLDVPFSVGEAIDSFQADDLPVGGASSTPSHGRSRDGDSCPRGRR